MTDYSLIKQLNKKEAEIPSPLAEGVEYKQYDLDVEGKIKTVYIPLREAENFQANVINNDTLITRKHLRGILRQYRGIRA